jgi:CTP synthase (UTP-ammonia lyase)
MTELITRITEIAGQLTSVTEDLSREDPAMAYCFGLQDGEVILARSLLRLIKAEKRKEKAEEEKDIKELTVAEIKSSADEALSTNTTDYGSFHMCCGISVENTTKCSRCGRY